MIDFNNCITQCLCKIFINIFAVVFLEFIHRFFFHTWGNPHGHSAALLGSSGVVSDLSSKIPRWSTWCSTGVLPFWGSHSSGLVWTLRGTILLNAIPWAVVQVRGDPRTSSAWWLLWPARAAQGCPSPRDEKLSSSPTLSAPLRADCEKLPLAPQHRFNNWRGTQTLANR